MASSLYTPQTVMFDGGLDFITPAITAAPGTLNNCFNFERTDRLGYSRCFGYERFDGGANASLAYTNLVYITHEENLGSTPPRNAMWIETVDTPIVLGYMIDAGLTRSLICITDFDQWRKVQASLPVLSSAHGDSFVVTGVEDFDTAYKIDNPDADASTLTDERNGLFNVMNATVGTVGTGSNPVLGLHGYKDQLYAISDFDVLAFSEGEVEVFVGDFIVPHGASTEDNLIVVRGLRLDSGTWAGGDAAGIILINQAELFSEGLWDVKRPNTAGVQAFYLEDGFGEESFLAGLWRTNNYNQSLASSEPEGWNPVDTGYQFDFENGTEYGPPVVFTRGEFEDQTTATIVNTDTADDGETTDSTFNGDPIVTDTWTVVGAATVAEALGEDDNSSYVSRLINNNHPVGPATTAGNILLSNYSAFSGFAASSSATIQGVEVTVRARFISRDGLAHNSSITVQPINDGDLVVGSSPIQKPIPYDNGAPTQPTATYTFGGPEELFGLTPEQMKAAMDSNFGFAIQPWVSPTAGDRIGEIWIFYCEVKVYFTITISGYYFWNGTDDVTAKITNYNLADGAWEDADAEGEIQVVDVEAVGSGERRVINAGDEIWTEPGGNGLHIADVLTDMEVAGLAPLSELEEAKSRYEIITANFYADADWEAFYGVSGARRGFSYDGFYFKNIYAVPDEDLDKPRHIAFHQFHLALGYGSGAVQLSATGEPGDFDGVNGAVEMDMGDPVTGLIRMNGTTLGVFCKKSIHGIVGTSSDNFSRQILSPYEGAIEYTVLDMGHPVYCSYRGISIFDQTAAYGDFAGQRLSTQVSPWLLPRIQGTVSPLGEVATGAGPVVAIACRTKNQYRLYFGDGYRLTMTLVEGNQPQFTMQAEGLYNSDIDWRTWLVPRAETSFVDNTGSERIYISHYSEAYGTPQNTHYVYEYDRSWTFDGYGIPSYFILNENFYGSAVDYDRFNKLRLYGLSLGYAPIQVHIETNYKEDLSPNQSIRLLGPISLPRSPADTITTDYKNVTNIVNMASEGRSFNFRFMSHDITGNPATAQDPLYASVCPPFVLQGMLVQTKEGRGDI